MHATDQHVLRRFSGCIYVSRRLNNAQNKHLTPSSVLFQIVQFSKNFSISIKKPHKTVEAQLFTCLLISQEQN